jgi:hypothetical protein
MMIARVVTIAARAALVVFAVVCVLALFQIKKPIWRPAFEQLATPWTAIAIIAGGALGGLLSRYYRSPGALLAAVPPRVFAWTAFAIALATGIWAHWTIQKGVPDVPDELGYLHQARTFADGFLAARSPPISEFHYASWAIHDGGSWYSVFPPGYGALLTVGVLAGVPWLVNPVLGALLVFVIWGIAREVFGGDGVGPRVAVVIYLGSWFRLLHAGSFMSHPTAALAAGLGVLGIWRGILRGNWPWAAIGGIALAYLGATRQLDAVVATIALAPLLVWAVVRRPSEWRNVLRRTAVAATCAVPLITGYLAYNASLTGDPLLPPQQRYMQLKERRGDCFRLGFGPGVGECPITQGTNYGRGGFQLEHARKNTRDRVDAWTRYSFGWAPLAFLPVVALVGGAIAGGATARRRTLIAGVFATTVVAYGLFFYHGVTYGARFYYVALPFVVVLAAAAVVDIARWLSRIKYGQRVAAALGGALPAILVCGMVTQFPVIKRNEGQRKWTQDGLQLAALSSENLRDAVVFVRSPIIAAAATRHPAMLEMNHPLVVQDHGDASNAGFMRLYPGRRPFRLSGARAIPLHYAADAPMRHEGGALYPLERSRDGFARRISRNDTGKLPVSADEALRFEPNRSGAKFALPIWTHDADAGAITLAIQFAANPKGAIVDLSIDGAAIANGVTTRAPTWQLVEQRFDLSLTPGRHWVEVALPVTRAGENVIVDYVELRRGPQPRPSPSP